MSRSASCPPEVRDRAVRCVAESRDDHGSEWAAIMSVASKLGIGTPETVRKWVRRADVEAGAQRGEFDSRDDLVARVFVFIEHRNQTARPFNWVHDAEKAA